MSINYVDRLPVPLEMDYDDTNVYLIESSSGNWLVDTGIDNEGNFEVLTERLQDRNLDWSDIAGVCATHLHPDHVGLAFEILSENEDLRFLIPEGPSYERRTVERAETWFRRIGVPEELYREFIDEVTDYPYIDFMKRLKDRAETISHGTSIQLGSHECRIVDARGHTPNQVNFYLPEDGLLFTGDHVLPHETPNVSVFPESLENNPLGQFHDSLEGLLKLELSTVYPGHGRPFENGDTRIRELLRHHDSRLEAIREVLNGDSLTTVEVAEDIPWSSGAFEDLDQVNSFLALGETLSHLVYLRARGEVNRSREEGIDYFSLAS